MTSRTVMAAWLGPASQRSGPRRVFVCVPDTLRPYHEAQIATVLNEIIRSGDQLLTAGSDDSDPIASFGALYGYPVTSVAAWPAPPDLIVIVLDPLADNTAALQARALAANGKSDLLIAELPDLSA
ncbi:hypothetical protein ACFVU2_19685 [Leifsonia sp. NPDC058194]|uniref:hypothetical protein n=1 Tax=Leifsonia sp. NPDC058194 TaxID=3346374 RepID=UPI0036DB2652